MTAASAESDVESKVVKEVLAATTIDEKTDEFDQLLSHHDLQKTLRISMWIVRFVDNCRPNVPKVEGPITTEEQESLTNWWIHRVQARAMNSPKFAADRMQLNLQTNSEGILECRGRIQGH